jgi:phosphoribulokinase
VAITLTQVRAFLELDRRERDSEAYIRPQRHYADSVVSFMPGQSQDPGQLDAHLFLRDPDPVPAANS